MQKNKVFLAFKLSAVSFNGNCWHFNAYEQDKFHAQNFEFGMKSFMASRSGVLGIIKASGLGGLHI